MDIFIPSLKIAFELNGIFHYEPIFPKKFKNIQKRDKQKIIECYKRNIGLCVIDTSKQKNFTEKTSKIFLNIIQNIIEEKLEETVGFQPTEGV